MQKVDPSKLSKAHALHLAKTICSAIEEGFKTWKQRILLSSGDQDFIILGAGWSSIPEYETIQLEPFVWGVTQRNEVLKRRYVFYLLEKDYQAFAKGKSCEEVTALLANSSVKAKKLLNICYLYTNIERAITKERRKLKSKRYKSVKARVWTKRPEPEKPKPLEKYKVRNILKRRNGWVSPANIAELLHVPSREVKAVLETLESEGKVMRSEFRKHHLSGFWKIKP